MSQNDIIFSFLLLVGSYAINKYLIILLKNSKFNFLEDNQFKKPQAFHDISTPRLGGIIIFIQLIIVCLYLFYSKNIFHLEYISFCLLFFFLGFLDDIKINLSQTSRFLFMIILLITLVLLNDFYVEKTGFTFLNNLLASSNIFSVMFICLCFLFIINGSNLIDGFNGLLGIHALIILIVLSSINFVNNNNDLIYILLFSSIIILVFLKFNFPHASMFLGDSGSYLIGSLLAISTVNTSILNPSISPFFFCILLVYLFFEAFFTFLRKYFIEKKHPLHPDNKHLHMLLHYFFLSQNKEKIKSNYLVSIYINFIYLILIIPSFFFKDDGLLCKYYFLFLIVLYFFIYFFLQKKKILD
jgi:UDP-N-acetylmuramyl pentapeptide phosphotransferase/UDP-N-acetylglucosamine-1-phosphate transferase